MSATNGSSPAATLGVDHNKLRTYQVALDWVKENGVLVTPHVYGTHLLTVRASLTELGLRADDPRAKRLQGLRRKLVGPHLTAHYATHTGGETMLGFSPDLPKPPAIYFAKVARLIRLEYLTVAGWLPLPVQPYQIDAAADSDDDGALSKWISLNGDYDWPVLSLSNGPVMEHDGEQARWLRLMWNDEGRVKVSDQDITVDPTNNLASLESRARASVDMNNPKGVKGYGQKLVGYGGYAWIGYKAWAVWQRDWQRYEAEMDCIKAYILWRYEEFQADIQDELERIAELAWKALRRKIGGIFKADLGNGADDNDLTQMRFKEGIINQGLARIPTPEVIASKLRLDYEVALVQAEADVERDRLAAEQLRAEQASVQARQAAADEWARTERRKAQAAADAAETEQRAMRQAAMEKARQQLEEAGSPLQQMVDNLRGAVYRKMLEAQRSLKERGSLHPKTVSGLRLLVEQFTLLNTHNDDEMEARLQEFEQLMPHSGGVKNAAVLTNIGQLVDEITALTREAAERAMQRNVADDFGTDNVRW